MNESVIDLSYSELIGLIYDTSLDPALWPTLLNSMSDVLDGFAESAITIDSESKVDDDLDRIAPHLKRAIELKRQYSVIQSKRNVFLSFLDNLPVGFIILDFEKILFWPIKVQKK